MMRSVVMLVTLVVSGAALAAQEPQCQNASFAEARTACNTAVDAARIFHPLAGMLASGGNPVLAAGGALGRLGRVSLSGRVNAMRVSLPDPDSAAESSVPSEFEGWIVAPVMEVGVGVFKGTKAGLFAIDLLGSAVLVPTWIDRLTVEDDAARVGDVALGLGYGARVGILPGAMLVPSLSVSVMRRHLPRVRYGDIFEGELADFATNLQATNVRLTAGLSFPVVDLAAGFGFDRYTAEALIRYIDIGGPEDIRLALTNTRQVLFLNAGLGMGPARVVGELGYQTGKDQRITTNFTGFDPTAGHVYWSAGLRFTF